MKGKRFISAVTAITMMFSGMAFLEYIPFNNSYKIAVAAFSVEESYQSSAAYTASCIIGGLVDLETGNRSESVTKYSDVITRNYAYEQLANNVMKDKGLVITSAMWDTFSKALDGKASAVDSELRQEQVYEAFLMDYLTFSEGSTENTSFLDKAGDFADKTMKYENKIFKKLLDKGIADDEKSLIDLIEKSDSLNDPKIIEAMKELNWEKDLVAYTEIIDDITEVATNAKDYFEALTKAMALKEVNDERIEFLKSMSEKASDNSAFQTAVDNIIETIESSYGEIALKEGVKTMGAFTWGKCWDSLSENIPYFSTFKTAHEVMNDLFNTDSMAENNIRIIMQYTAGQYAKQILMSAYIMHSTSGTEEADAAFVEAYKNYLAYQDYSSEWAKDFVEAVPFASSTTVGEWISDLNSDINYCNSGISFANKYAEIYDKAVYQSYEWSDSDNIIEIEDSSSYVSYRGNYAINNALTLKQDMTINGNLNLNESVNLNGYTLTVNGDLIQNAGKMNINRGTLNVNGNYTIQNTGTLYMIYNDSVNVHGNFKMKSDIGCSNRDNYNTLGHGTIAIGGNFYQYNGNNGNEENFQTIYDDFTVKFVGSYIHEIYFESNLSYMDCRLDVPDDAKIKFTGVFHGFTLVRDIVIDGDVTYDCGTMNLNKHRLTIDGNLIQNGGTINVNSGTLTTNGNLIQNAGKMNINRGTLNVNGNYTIQNTGTLYMIYNDSVSVHGDFKMKSDIGCSNRDNYNTLGHGTIAIGGNFYQYNGNNGNEENFQIIYDDFTVKFVGIGTHKIISESSKTKIPYIVLTDGVILSFNGNFDGFSPVSFCTFSSSDPTVAKITGNTVQSVGAGTAKLTIKNESGSNTSINLKVQSLIIGDLNYDEDINVADAVLMQKYLLSCQNFTKTQWELADMNQDGWVDVFDMVEMRKLLIQNK